MTTGLTPEIQEAFGPWEPSTYRGAPMTGTQSWEHAVARYPFLKGWRGVTPEAQLAARYHPDPNLRMWLNALLTEEEARAEVGRRREAGLETMRARMRHDANAQGGEATANVSWANAYD